MTRKYPDNTKKFRVPTAGRTSEQKHRRHYDNHIKQRRPGFPGTNYKKTRCHVDAEKNSGQTVNLLY